VMIISTRLAIPDFDQSALSYAQPRLTEDPSRGTADRPVHDSAYVEALLSRLAAVTDDQGLFINGGDTYANKSTLHAAKLACGAVLQIVDAVGTGSATRGVALVRPPGHHAEPECAMGFCFFNNVAVAAQTAISKHGYKRILIVDWDVHHGELHAITAVDTACSGSNCVHMYNLHHCVTGW
jgi:acetoin utilization deacetylase AcuC-like enzyme